MSQLSQPDGSTFRSRFRITDAWPGVPVPMPGVLWTPSVDVLDDDHLLYDFEYQHRPLVDQLVIQGLLDVDTDSLEAVRSFIATHGVIDHRTVLRQMLPGFLPVSSRVLLGGRSLQSQSAHRVHWMDVAAHLAHLQHMARHFIAHERGESTADAWTGDMADVDTDWTAWLYFTLALNNGLRTFSMHLVVEEVDTQSRFGHPAAPDLFSALCLQLWNLLAEGLPVKVCPLCGRSFVRQRDRSEHGQHRTIGVMFCSKSCARAQANRDYRKRKREEKS